MHASIYQSIFVCMFVCLSIYPCLFRSIFECLNVWWMYEILQLLGKFESWTLSCSKFVATTGRFELQSSCMKCSYLTHWAIRLDNWIPWKSFTVQILPWSLKFVILNSSQAWQHPWSMYKYLDAPLTWIHIKCFHELYLNSTGKNKFTCDKAIEAATERIL